MPFSALGISKHLIKGLEKLKYTKPYPIQEQTIPAILNGKDVLGIAQTGSGKTASYVLPILMNLEGKTTTKNNTPSASDKRNHKEKRQARAKKQTAPTVVYHKLMDRHSGDACPDCQRGKLYQYEPGKLLRITGHAPFEATQHVTEQLRCNACQIVYKGPRTTEAAFWGHFGMTMNYAGRSSSFSIVSIV